LSRLGTRIIVVSLLEVFALAGATRAITIVFIVALLLIDRSSARWRIIGIRWPLIDDRSTDLTFTHEAVSVPSLWWRITVGQVTLGVARIRTISGHFCGVDNAEDGNGASIWRTEQTSLGDLVC